MGKILAYSGLMEGKEVTWMPAYGPEQRGGTANVTVIISDEKISSPILSKYDAAIILNQPSLEKFESKGETRGRSYLRWATALSTRPHVRTYTSIALMPWMQPMR